MPVTTVLPQAPARIEVGLEEAAPISKAGCLAAAQESWLIITHLEASLMHEAMTCRHGLVLQDTSWWCRSDTCYQYYLCVCVCAGRLKHIFFLGTTPHASPLLVLHHTPG